MTKQTKHWTQMVAATKALFGIRIRGEDALYKKWVLWCYANLIEGEGMARTERDAILAIQKIQYAWRMRKHDLQDMIAGPEARLARWLFEDTVDEFHELHKMHRSSSFCRYYSTSSSIDEHDA